MPYIPGDHKMVCGRCGFFGRRSEMIREWTGLWVHITPCHEPRNPQLDVKALHDKISVDVARPDSDPVYVTDGQINPRNF